MMLRSRLTALRDAFGGCLLWLGAKLCGLRLETTVEGEHNAQSWAILLATDPSAMANAAIGSLQREDVRAAVLADAKPKSSRSTGALRMHSDKHWFERGRVH